MMLRIYIQRLGAIYYHILLCLLRFLLCPPKRSFRRHIVFALFLIKSPNEVWRLIVFAPFIIIIIMNICQNLWPHLYRKLPKEFPQDLAYILNRVGRIFWPKENRERMAAIFKLAADKIGKISMFSDFNENWYPFFVLKGVQIGARFTKETCA
jgi:hypothetical protein